MAWGLAERGIAVYRYDKRTYLYPNESSLDETFDMEKETTLDAVDAVNMVAQLPYVDTENIVVLGHSQGGYKIPAIAEKADQADKFIIMSGPARSLPDLMVEQYTFLTTVNGVQTEQGKQMVAALKADIAKLTDDSVPDSEILPMLGARKYYWKQTLGYDPIEVSKSITEPGLCMEQVCPSSMLPTPSMNTADGTRSATAVKSSLPFEVGISWTMSPPATSAQ